MSSCRHTAPLVAALRFRELDADAQRHVAHLEYCAACRAAIADDRALTRHVERALRARVDGIAPSPAAWRTIEHRVSTAPRGWRARWARWLALPKAGLASAGAVSALALVLLVSGLPGGRPVATGETAAIAQERTTLPIRSSPMLETARVPAEQLDVPTPPDLDGVVMEALYARPAKGPDDESVVAAWLAKAPASEAGDAVDEPPSGTVVVAYMPADAE